MKFSPQKNPEKKTEREKKKKKKEKKKLKRTRKKKPYTIHTYKEEKKKEDTHSPILANTDDCFFSSCVIF